MPAVQSNCVVATHDSSKTAAVWNDPIGAEQNHCTFLIRKTERQNLGQKLPDLSRREIDDGGDLPAYKIFGLVVRCDLGAGLFPADGRAEIDQQLKSRFPCLGKRSRFDDRANANVNGKKVVEGDNRRRWSFKRMSHIGSLPNCERQNLIVLNGEVVIEADRASRNLERAPSDPRRAADGPWVVI